MQALTEWQDDDIVVFFEQTILAVYRNEPHKYHVETDNFEGRVRIEESFASECAGAGVVDNINVRFGFRSLKSGELAIGAFVPDLNRMSDTHKKRWQGFIVREEQLNTGHDSRWKMWTDRYLLGSWTVENGPRYRLRDTILTINALTLEVVEQALFEIHDNASRAIP